MARLDELHAHQYAQRRVVDALIRHDPDPPSRFPRSAPALWGGLLIAALIAVAMLVINQGSGAPADLKNGKSVLIEKESGAAYVYVEADGQLHPVLNYSSALLIADGAGAAPTTVRRSRLAALRSSENVPVGATLGIADAPTVLPREADLLAGPWQVCTRNYGSGARTDLFIGSGAVAGGRPLAVAGASGRGEALLVQSPDNQAYLIFGNRKFRIPVPRTVLTAFAWGTRQRQPVSAGWLNALPTGPDLATPTIPRWGEPSAVLAQTVGQLYRAPRIDGGFQWAVVQHDRVQPISEVQAQLLDSDRDTLVGKPIEVDAAEFGALPHLGDRVDGEPGQEQLPATIPSPVSIGTLACLQVASAGGAVSTVLIDPTPAVSPGSARGTAGADRVSVPFGHGVLVRSVASPTAPVGSGATSIITADGIRYPIADTDALRRLGYASVPAQAVPAELVSLLPAGPVLSTSAAMRSW